MELINVLKEKFGYTTFRTGQQEVIEQLIAGNDVVALLPTGMGKSLCYQLPAYVMNKPVLIVSPLLSLMQDQVDQMKQFGEKRVIALNSFLTPKQKEYALHFLNEYRFIFTSPEMLLQPVVKERLASIELGLIVADEAHCISQWGFDFRPDYLRIHELIAVTNRPPILALSATATPTVLEDIKKYLTMHEPFEYMHNVDRQNIRIAQVNIAHKEEKIEWILNHVAQTAGPGIIYTQSRAKAESISLALLQQHVSASAYHAGKDNDDRQFIQQQFINGELEWIVATNAFGMGVHKDNIRQVIHETMPSTIANYMQEIGRAGRDGKDAVAILLYCENDEQLAKFIVTEDLPKEFHVNAFLSAIENGENPKNLLTNGVISETAFRVIEYWLAQEDAQQLKLRLQNMENTKLQEVDNMLQILLSNQCIREKIVEYFGQTLQHKPEPCCSHCGLVLDDVVQKRVKKLEKKSIQSWQQRLKQLLLKA